MVKKKKHRGQKREETGKFKRKEREIFSNKQVLYN